MSSLREGLNSELFSYHQNILVSFGWVIRSWRDSTCSIRSMHFQCSDFKFIIMQADTQEKVLWISLPRSLLSYTQHQVRFAIASIIPLSKKEVPHHSVLKALNNCMKEAFNLFLFWRIASLIELKCWTISIHVVDNLLQASFELGKTVSCFPQDPKRMYHICICHFEQ